MKKFFSTLLIHLLSFFKVKKASPSKIPQNKITSFDKVAKEFFAKNYECFKALADK